MIPTPNAAKTEKAIKEVERSLYLTVALVDGSEFVFDENSLIDYQIENGFLEIDHLVVESDGVNYIRSVYIPTDKILHYDAHFALENEKENENE